MCSHKTSKVLGRASDDEALELTIAYYCVVDPEHRAEILALAQKRAREAVRVEGITHFLDLDRTAKDRH